MPEKKTSVQSSKQARLRNGKDTAQNSLKGQMGFSEVLLSSPGSVLGLVLVLLLVYWFYKDLNSDAGPPGPKPLPVLGNLLQLNMKRPYLTLLKFSQQYGSVFTVWMGPQKVVVLAGYKTVKEALVNHAEVFGDRDAVPIFVETQDKNCQGKPFDTTEMMSCAVSNIICSLLYGNRFQYDDSEFTTIIASFRRNMQLLGSPSIQIYNWFPWLGRLVPNRNEIFKQREQNKSQVLKFVRKLRATLNPHMCRGFVDAFLVQQEKEKGVPNSPFHEENLAQTVIQLFFAGTDTTATTLRWALLLMAKYPHIQDQVREEITRLIGARQVQVEDRKDLPFTDAVIHETQRFVGIAPFGLPHKTTKDITFQGHFIKKGTTIWPFLFSVLNDESQWENPNSFYPAHFLNKDGKFKKKDAFMPFSAGRRVCLGEGLARMELFIFFVTLIQRFRFTAQPGVTEEELDLTGNVGLSRDPVEHKLCAIPCF
ncbi:hypothetical protein WMY93_015282 [Mugilogobius chulae]|uniref:Cytochrome P450 n=1 Tax=Mugilogobius chulae TaxID=88201 RepID=A0AAW0NWS3_9GOBI